MNILVTGGFGFIGSYLIPYLLRQGAHVGVIARRVPETFRRLAEQVDCHVHDLSQAANLRLPRSYDCCVHLAGAEQTIRCLELCRSNGISRLVHFSTFQVYGRDHGFVDENTPVSCVNDYALAHYAAEEQVRRAHRAGILDYLIVRPTNGYGFSEHHDVHRWPLVPSCFCQSAAEQQEIVLRTSGHQQKDFIHLEHTARLTYGLCTAFDRSSNQVVNVASGSSHSVLDVAELVRGAYERLSGQRCALRALSGLPERAEPLRVSTEKTAALGLESVIDASLATEVHRTLTFLRQVEAVSRLAHNPWGTGGSVPSISEGS